MAYSINDAFREFLKDTVNLDTTDTDTARKSKDWLINQINLLPGKSSEFPELVPAYHIHYGSFARRTKARPLNDIDLMIGIHAKNATHDVHDGDKVTLYANSNSSILNNMSSDGSTINSIKIVNRFVSHLSKIHQYKNADINRRQEAAVLSLTSYDWSFDIVPCFMASGGYYVIPDGQGNWKKTDPRIDRDKAARINQDHDGNVLNVIRVIKYWNKRRIVTTVPSYLLENIILNYYSKLTSRKASPFVDVEIAGVLDDLAAAIYLDVQDPKGIQGNINNLSYRDKINISSAATTYAAIAREARAFEGAGNQRSCISRWKDFFGTYFPSYG